MKRKKETYIKTKGEDKKKTSIKWMIIEIIIMMKVIIRRESSNEIDFFFLGSISEKEDGMGEKEMVSICVKALYGQM